MMKKRNTKDNKYSRVEELIISRVQNGGVPSKTGYKGVNSDNRPGRKPYKSQFHITYNNRMLNISLGSYNTPEEAYIARIKFIDSLK